jgi:peroxiredoxin Q/BCP
MVKEGDKLATFSLPDQDGKIRTLKDLAGKKGLVLYFYPKDNTPGCTLEAQDFRDRLGDFEALGFNVAGVSRDSVKSHCGFAAKYGLDFPLLSDAEGVLLEAAGAWQEKKNYGRTYMGIVRSTVVVDAKGKVLKVYPKVSAKGHALKVLEHLGEGGA